MPDWGIALTPTTTIQVEFTAAPVTILLHSLLLAEMSSGGPDALPGLAEWPRTLAASLTPDEQTELRIIYWFISDRLLFDHQDKTFPDFLTFLEQHDPVRLRDEAVVWMQHLSYFPGFETLLTDFERYDQFIRRLYEEKPEKRWEYDRGLHTHIWNLLRDPISLKARMLRFLNTLWDRHLRAEWKRVQPMIAQAAEMFSQQDYSTMNAGDIVEYVTARDLRSRDYFGSEIAAATHLTFAVSPYLGPYVTWMHDEGNGHDLVFFGARQPRNVHRQNDALTRNELLISLNALADETRLRILEMLVQQEEICAQDFITALDLSQSSASRHLRQLTASGYLTERRRDVAKCYSLNQARIEDTIQALRQFLG